MTVLDEDGSLNDLVDAQIKQQGLSVLHVSDGYVFTFPVAALERMLEQARPTGRVVVFIKEGAKA